MPEPETACEKPQLVASRLHLAIFLWIQLAMAIRGGSTLRRFLAATDAETFHFRKVCYFLLILSFEWALLCFVWYGVRGTGTSLRTLVGGRWNSVWGVAKDVGIGLGIWLLWMVALMVFAMFAKFSGIHPRPPDAVLALLPQTGLEVILWLAVSISAGICEEVMYRGYLQRQFLAMSGRLPVAIIGQGLLFGLVHSYEGPFAVATIAVMGILFGLVAAWRKSLRPGIVAHAWYDAVIGVLTYIMFRFRKP